MSENQDGEALSFEPCFYISLVIVKTLTEVD